MNSIRFDARPLRHQETPKGVTRRHLVLGSAAAVLAVPLTGCGGAALFAPFFAFTFVGVVDRKIVSMSFSPPNRDQSTGRIDLQSFITASDPKNGAFFVSSNFDGSFNGRDLQIALAIPLAIPLAPLAPRYSGVFVEDGTIVLTPTVAGPLPITVRIDKLDPQEDRFLPALTGDWVGTDANNAPWKLSLANDPASDPGEAVVLLAGKEAPGTAQEALLSGHASVHYIELDIARAGGSVKLKGTLQADPSKRVVGTPQVAATIGFEGGGTLRRVP